MVKYIVVGVTKYVMKEGRSFRTKITSVGCHVQFSRPLTENHAETHFSRKSRTLLSMQLYTSLAAGHKTASGMTSAVSTWKSATLPKSKSLKYFKFFTTNLCTKQYKLYLFFAMVQRQFMLTNWKVYRLLQTSILYVERGAAFIHHFDLSNIRAFRRVLGH